MREILFRGKDENTGKWQFGSLIVWPSGPREIFSVISVQPDEMERHHVDPDTVGQYTGMADKNGKKIFEGDIVAFTNDDDETTPYEVRWCIQGWAVRMAGGDADADTLDEFFAGYSVVAGNIHDNPELMEAAL